MFRTWAATAAAAASWLCAWAAAVDDDDDDDDDAARVECELAALEDRTRDLLPARALRTMRVVQFRSPGTLLTGASLRAPPIVASSGCGGKPARMEMASAGTPMTVAMRC